MDVLLIEEENMFVFVLVYKGVMYVCGYDGYMVILLGVVFVFF